MSPNSCSAMYLCPLFRRSFCQSTFVFINIAGSSFIFNIFMDDVSESSCTPRGQAPFFLREEAFSFFFINIVAIDL